MSGDRFAYQTVPGSWHWVTGPTGGEPTVGATLVPAWTWRAELGGLGGSSREQTAAGLPVFRAGPGGFTGLSARWADLHPAPGVLGDVSTLAAGFAWADSLGLPVLLRVDVAARPDWVTPDWWAPDWVAAFLELSGLLAGAAGVGDAATLSAVALPGSLLSHGFAAAAVLGDAVARGFTTEQDVSAARGVISGHAAVWGPLGVGGLLMLAAHDGVDAATGARDASTARALDLAEWHADCAHDLAMWGVTGFLPGTSGPLVLWAAGDDHPLHVRMATAGALTTAGTTSTLAVRAAIDLGAASVEVTPAAATWTPEEAAALNAELRADGGGI